MAEELAAGSRSYKSIHETVPSGHRFRFCVHRVQSDPRHHGPVIASVMPGVWMLTNIVFPVGSQQAPQNSLSRWSPASAVLPASASCAEVSSTLFLPK